jgi:hypothetical protein
VRSNWCNIPIALTIRLFSELPQERGERVHHQGTGVAGRFRHSTDLLPGAPLIAHFAMSGFRTDCWTVATGFSCKESPKRDVSVESHPCAQNAQGWGTRRQVDGITGGVPPSHLPAKATCEIVRS